MELAESHIPALHLPCHVIMGKWRYPSLFPRLKNKTTRYSLGLFSRSVGYCTCTFMSWMLCHVLVTASKPDIVLALMVLYRFPGEAGVNSGVRVKFETAVEVLRRKCV